MLLLLLLLLLLWLYNMLLLIGCRHGVCGIGFQNDWNLRTPSSDTHTKPKKNSCLFFSEHTQTHNNKATTTTTKMMRKVFNIIFLVAAICPAEAFAPSIRSRRSPFVTTRAKPTDEESEIPLLPPPGESSYSAPSTNKKQDSRSSVLSKKFEIQYTCKKCETRNSHFISRAGTHAMFCRLLANQPLLFFFAFSDLLRVVSLQRFSQHTHTHTHAVFFE